MRLWSIHPQFLDHKGLVAVWREGLLAKKVLEGKTKGYRNHPQLTRFKKHSQPLAAINAYLWGIFDEATKRSYSFDSTKLSPRTIVSKISVTRGQFVHETQHLKKKLAIRSPQTLSKLAERKVLTAHPLFKIIPGKVEAWEKISDAQNKKE